MEMVLQILINMILLLGLILLVSMTDTLRNVQKRFLQIGYGITIGFFGIFIMMNAWSLQDGIFYDTRSILISNVALFFPHITSILAVIITTIYRIIVGGDGVYAGVLTILSSLFIGLFFKRYIYQKTSLNKYVELYIFGFVVHIAMLFSQLAFPYPKSLAIISNVAPIVIIAYPIASLILGVAITNNYERLANYKALNKNLADLRIQKERYQQLSNYSDTIVWELDAKGMYTYVDAMIEPILKVKPTEVIGKKYFYEFIAKEDRKRVIKEALTTMEKRKSFNDLVYRNIAADGTIVWLSTNGFPIYDQNGNFTGYRGSDKDISHLIEQQTLLDESEAKYKTIFEQSPLGMVQYNEEGFITVANDAFVKLLDTTHEKLAGLNLLRLPDKKFVRAVTLSLEDSFGIYQDYYHAVTSEKVIPIRVQFYPLKSKDNTIIGGIGIVENLTDYIKSREEIQTLSTTDHLTGLYNRIMLDQYFIEFNDSDQLPFGFIMGDINTLRIINESFGFEIGNKVILEVAKALKEHAKDGDLIFRIGGDEFAVLMASTNETVIESYIEKVKQTLNHNAIDMLINVSFGYALKDTKEKPFDECFREAEHMLHSNKIYDDSSISKKTIDLIMTTLFEKSERELLHSQRVSTLSEEIAIQYKLGTNFKNRVRIAALLHDIGKINIDGHILNKPGRLDDYEWSIVKKHPEHGFKILNAVDEYIDIARIVLLHHERWDGTGYPRGIKANKIPLEARIIAVADAYDAMTKDRTYREGLSMQEAINELMHHAGKQFDPKVVDIFIHKVLPKGEAN